MSTPAESSLSASPILHAALDRATQDASAAMSTWTNGDIDLKLSEVCELPIEEVVSYLDMGEEMASIVALGLMGDYSGQILLTFDDENGLGMAATILGRDPASSTEWSELEQSALCETGNIVACAYVRQLAEFIGENLIPSPPSFMQDFAACVIEQAVMSQAAMYENVLVCNTNFRRREDELSWKLLLVPDPSLLESIRNCCNF